MDLENTRNAHVSEIASRITLDMTCAACPEQYDAYLDSSYVGHLRLRHGNFTVSHEGETLYQARTRGDGIFEESERDHHLTCARVAIAEWVYGKTSARWGALNPEGKR